MHTHRGRSLTRGASLALMGTLLATLLAALASPMPADAAIRCTGDPAQISPLTVTTAVGQTTDGFYSVPSSPPRGLVIFSHGYQSAPQRYFTVMGHLAAAGFASAAMFNPGDIKLNGGLNTRGWNVREGAAAGIAAAQAIDAACPKRLRHRLIIDYGVSMGGNTSGLMAATSARRATGEPLFDYWFDIEGATNVIETYFEAQLAGASGSTYAQEAYTDIGLEAGGPFGPATAPAFANMAVVTHAEDIEQAGIKGVVLVHGLDDGTVPHDQSREMLAGLISADVPTDYYTALRTQPGERSGSTLDGLVPAPHTSPFAGHQDEGDESQTVTGTGLSLLKQTLEGTLAPPACHREYIIDSGTITPAAGSPACPGRRGS